MALVDVELDHFVCLPVGGVGDDFVALGRNGFEMITQRIKTGERVDRRVIRPALIARQSVGMVRPQ